MQRADERRLKDDRLGVEEHLSRLKTSCSERTRSSNISFNLTVTKLTLRYVHLLLLFLLLVFGQPRAQGSDESRRSSRDVHRSQGRHAG